MWTIWWARRKAAFDELFQSPLSTRMFINKFLAELEMIPPPLNHAKERRMLPRDMHDLTRVQQLPKWCPLVEHATKINADGGFSKIGDRGASAAVCRNKEAGYLGASAVIYEGLQDPTILQAEACLEALALTKDLNTQSVCIASDCLEVVSNIDKEVPCCFVAILLDIKNLGSYFSGYKIYSSE